MKKGCFSVLLAVFALFIGQSVLANPVTLKFAVVDSAQAPTVKKAYEPWCEIVEKASQGTVKIQVYPGGTLGRDSRVQAKLVADGVADLTYFNPPYVQGRFPQDEVFTLPGIAENGFESTIASQRMLDKGLLKGYTGDLICVAHYTTDVFHLHTTFPVRVPEDIKGRKIRAGNDFWAQVLHNLGAVPVAMQYVQAAENLSRGVIEGTINDDSAVITFRVADVAKYHTVAPLGTFPLAVVMNRPKFDSLPEKAQSAILENGPKLGLMWQQAVVDHGKELYDMAQTDPKTQIIKLTAGEVQQWKDALKPTLEWWAGKESGRTELLEQYMNELEAVRAEKK